MGIKRATTAAVACGLFAAGGLAIAGSTAAQEPSPPTGTLQLMQRDRETRFHFIDVPPRQGQRQPPTPGDGFLITGAVRFQASGNRAGRLQAVFVITNVRREEAQVSATFLLRGGRIMVSGADTKPRVDDFAITGGTGRYAGARGTLRVAEHRRSTAFLFSFLG